MYPAYWLKKGLRLSKPSAWGNFSVSPTRSTRPSTECGARPTSVRVHRNLCWQLTRDGNLHGSVMSHATHDSLFRTLRQGTLEGGRRRGRQRKCWMDHIKEWTSLTTLELLTSTSFRTDWKKISAESSPMSPRRPNRSRDWTELNWSVFVHSSNLSLSLSASLCLSLSLCLPVSSLHVRIFPVYRSSHSRYFKQWFNGCLNTNLNIRENECASFEVQLSL